MRLLFVILLFYKILLCNDTFEDNNSFETAKEIGTGEYNSLQIVSGDEDYFKLKNLVPGLLHIQIESGKYIGSNTALYVVLYNSNKNPIAAHLLTSEKGYIDYNIIFSSDYYIKIYAGYNGGSNTYSLNISRYKDYIIDDENENNDNFNQATIINDYRNEIQGIANDSDWYKFISPPGTYTFELTYDNSQENLELKIYDKDYLLIGQSNVIDSITTVEVNFPYKKELYVSVEGSKGTSYKLKNNHPIKWMKEISTAGPISSSPVSFDIDNDGKNEIIVGTRPYLDSQSNEIKTAKLLCLEDDGTVKWEKIFPAVNHADPITGKIYTSSSISSRPLISDINNDGLQEILIGGDISKNDDAYTKTGGIFHVYDRWGREIIDGFRDYIKFDANTNDYSFIKGKYEEQTIWSTPTVGDLDGDE